MKIPAQYAKFIASLGGLLVAYLQMYGPTWHLVPAVTVLGAALAVLGVPNASSTPTVTLGVRAPQGPPPVWPGNRPPGTQ